MNSLLSAANDPNRWYTSIRTKHSGFDPPHLRSLRAGTQRCFVARSPHEFPPASLVDCDREKVICPAGRESSSWKPMVDRRGNDVIHVQFARSDCSVCPHLSQCTSVKGRRRTVNFKPRELYEALQQTRLRENAEEFKEEYRNRAGIEGTISQGVRAFGLRRSRYMGKSKTRLQHLATAAAINLERVSDWFGGMGREQTRRSAFARVMQPLTA